MSCTREIVMGVEEGLLLLPSNLFNELFLPFPQSYKGGNFYEGRKPRMWYGSMEKPSDRGMKPRGTGVFLPQRPPVTSSSSSQEKKKKPCPIISSKSNSRQIFLPKEWAY